MACVLSPATKTALKKGVRTVNSIRPIMLAILDLDLDDAQGMAQLQEDLRAVMVEASLPIEPDCVPRPHQRTPKKSRRAHYTLKQMMNMILALDPHDPNAVSDLQIDLRIVMIRAALLEDPETTKT